MAREIGAHKRRAGLPLQNFEVERAVLEAALADADRLGLPREPVRALVRALVETAVRAQEEDRVLGASSSPRSALIVGGSGRMGAWFGRFLEEQGYRVAVEDPRPSDRPKPSRGETFDLVLVATPPSMLAESLERARAWCGRGSLLVDIASIKGAGVAALEGIAADGIRVASIHPLFGPSVETLAGRTVLVMDCGAREAANEAAALFAGTAARIERVPLRDHDRLMGEVLGLSHATSLVFNEALAGGPFPFARLESSASTTFRRQAELSREVAGENAGLYFEIQRLNPETPAVLARLERAVESLRRIVAAADRKGFEASMERAAAYYAKGVEPRSR